ncbi:acetyltransferase [Haloechinothrix sp. LS1_15]|nr:acetyltransferase [Haloechinothrix sp. LS1_15]
MHQPHVVPFWQQDWSLPRWREEIATQLAGEHSLPCLVARDGTDIAYLEVYRVLRDRLAGYYPHAPYDLGVHVAIGEWGCTGRGIGRSLLAEISAALLRQDGRCSRVVAEPDTTNQPSLAAFEAAGFRATGEIALPEKVATLMVRARPGTPDPVTGD